MFENNTEGNLSRHLSAGASNYLSAFQYRNYALSSILRDVDLLKYENGVLRDGVHRLYKGDLSFLNIIKFRSARVNLISFISIRKALLSLGRFS
jgi:hypothetical protein